MDATAKIFFDARGRENRAATAVCRAFVDPLRLIAAPARTIPLPNVTSIDTVTAAVHRFEESIAGRAYLIEVAAVSKDRWRAYIVRIPGVPTALMPFYGPTPAEAAHLLCDWLTRAHARAANPAATV